MPHVVIVGGGTAGWMTAAALAVLLPGVCTVELVESEEIGIVGVGEATLPHLRAFVERLGIDEGAFVAATHATMKLGIRFENFGHIGEAYVHPFGSYGTELQGVPFHHFWTRIRQAGHGEALDAYSVAVAAAAANRFERPSGDARDPLESFGYAYQFDATLFAPFLRSHAERHGASRVEGRVTAIERDEAGSIARLVLQDGQTIAGDLFIDCTGFRALLIGEEPAAGWEDWSHWLPCDRAVAVPCRAPDGPIEPYTRAIAQQAGWRWRIPLQHRIGNGYVYASCYLDDAAAQETLLSQLEGDPLAEPRLLRFKAGRRRLSWVGNVVAIGLSSGFLEPLESTSIYLVQMAITELIEHFPGHQPTDVDRRGYNRQVDYEYDRIRDFLILHYHVTVRDDGPFWDHVRTMTIPNSLINKMALFRETGRVARYDHGLFLEPSWVAVAIGQGLVPEGWDPRADAAEPTGLLRAMDALRREIVARVGRMPGHQAALRSIMAGR